jgi:hypothetical protein
MYITYVIEYLPELGVSKKGEARLEDDVIFDRP